MIVQTQPTGIHDGLQFTLEHSDISGLEKAEGLLFMLLIKVRLDGKTSSLSLKLTRGGKLSYFIFVHILENMSYFILCLQIKAEFEEFMNSLNTPQGK